MDAPDSRILLRPGDLDRGSPASPRCSRAWPSPGLGPRDEPGMASISGPRLRLRTPAASGSSWRGPAACPFRHPDGDQLSPSGWRTPCGMHRGRKYQHHGNREDPVGGRRGIGHL